MTNILVSIIIPVYNDWQRLSVCMQALLQQTYAKDMFEIIVVNNNKDDTVPQDFILPANCIIITEKKPGSYAARNAALKIARGAIIGFTDSDCIPDKNWISYAVNYFKENPSCKRIAGSVVIFCKSLKSRIEMYDRLFAFPQKNYVEKSGTSVTANLFTYREVFESVGCFNETLMSGGDFLWGTIANKNGFKVDYVDEVMVKHPARDSLKELINKERRIGAGQGIFLKDLNQSSNGIYSFLKDIKPRLGDFKFISAKGKELSLVNKLYIFLLRQYLLAIRGYNKYMVQTGKTPT